MSESRRPDRAWEPDDDLEAVRLESMRQLAEAAQLTAMGKNVRLYKGTQGGTTIAVDEAPPQRPAVVRAIVIEVDPNGDKTLVLVRLHTNSTDTVGFPVRKASGHSVGDPIYIFQPAGGVIGDPTYDPDGDEPESPVLWEELKEANVMVRVTVVQTGGAAGNKTTPCSFTYTAKDHTDYVLGTNLAPEMARPSIGKMIAGTRGMGYHDGANFHLTWVDEVSARAAC